MKYKLVIFDMDGSILDTLEDLADATNYALHQNGFSERTIDEIRRFVGNGIIKLIERACPENTPDEVRENVRRSFVSYYGEHCADHTKPYEGIPELLQKLRVAGIKCAVDSNKPDFAVKELCSRYFNGLFDFALGSREGCKNKPDAGAVNEIISLLGIDKTEAVFIGDSDVDVQTALNAGIQCIGVEWGFRGREFLLEHGAHITVKNTGELSTILGV